MDERQVLTIIEQELRRKRLPPISPHSLMGEALRNAAKRIAEGAAADRRRAANTASQVGYAVTRGRTRL